MIEFFGQFLFESFILSIQQDINDLTWQMSFNYQKCKVMHLGRKNIKNEYTMKLEEDLIPHQIEKILVERALGILLSSDL